MKSEVKRLRKKLKKAEKRLARAQFLVEQMNEQIASMEEAAEALGLQHDVEPRWLDEQGRILWRHNYRKG